MKTCFDKRSLFLLVVAAVVAVLVVVEAVVVAVLIAVVVMLPQEKKLQFTSKSRLTKSNIGFSREHCTQRVSKLTL